MLLYTPGPEKVGTNPECLRKQSLSTKRHSLAKHQQVATQRVLVQPCLDMGVETIETRPHIHRLKGHEDTLRRGEAQLDDPCSNLIRSSTESASRRRTVSPPTPSTCIAQGIAAAGAIPAHGISRNTTGAGRRAVARASVNHSPRVETPTPWRQAKALRVRPLPWKRAISQARCLEAVRRLRRSVRLDCPGAAPTANR